MDVILVHYMNELSLAHPNKKYLQKVIDLLSQDLASLKLMVAPKKVQRMSLFSFLGFFITKDIRPLTFKLNVKDKYTLTDIQQLCSTINWLTPFLPVPE